MAPNRKAPFMRRLGLMLLALGTVLTVALTVAASSGARAEGNGGDGERRPVVEPVNANAVVFGPHAVRYSLAKGVDFAAGRAGSRVADLRQVEVRSPGPGRLDIVVDVVDVPRSSRRLRGIYTALITYSDGAIGLVSYSTKKRTGGGRLYTWADGGRACTGWTVTAGARADRVRFSSSRCAGVEAVQTVGVEGYAVAGSAGLRGHDLTSPLRHRVEIRVP